MPSHEEQLAAYLSEIRQLPLLTFAEEREGLKHGRGGDESARKRVIEGHLVLTALLALGFPPDRGGLSPIVG